MSTNSADREDKTLTSLPAIWSAPAPAADAEDVPSLASKVANDFLFSYRNPSTRQNYAQGLRAWFRFCVANGTDPLAADRSLIERCLLYWEEVEGKARRTTAGRFSAIRGFYRRAMIDGVITTDPCTYLKAPPVERKTSTNDLTRVELVRVLKLARQRSPRDYAAFCLLGYNGLRVSELVGIDIEHLGRERGFFIVTVTRKGGSHQTLALSQETAWAVEEYVGDRRSGPLFTSRRTPGKRMTRGDVQSMVKRYARWAGITRRISPHSFRHTFITQSLNANVSQREVQIAAGHADGRMTAYYDHGSSNRGREATHALTAFVAEMMDD